MFDVEAVKIAARSKGFEAGQDNKLSKNTKKDRLVKSRILINFNQLIQTNTT